MNRLPTDVTDDEIALFAQLVRSGALPEIVKVVLRFPIEWWGDTLSDLEGAEKRQLPGSLSHEFHHDARGIVRAVDYGSQRHRQGKRKTA